MAKTFTEIGHNWVLAVKQLIWTKPFFFQRCQLLYFFGYFICQRKYVLAIAVENSEKITNILSVTANRVLSNEDTKRNNDSWQYDRKGEKVGLKQLRGSWGKGTKILIDFNGI